MLVNLKQILSPEAVAQVLHRLPGLKTTVLDTAFPNRPVWPFPHVGLAELKAAIGTIPVVSRGSQPIAVENEELDISTIAPLPVKPSTEVLAWELNDLKALQGLGGMTPTLDAWRTRKVDVLRRLVRATTEAMASTVLYTGKVAWPHVLAGGGIVNYVVDYGAPLSLTLATKLSATSKASDIFDLLNDMADAVQDAGIGGTVTFHAGRDVFKIMLDILQAYASTVRNSSLAVDLSKQGVIGIGGYEILRMNETYKDPITGASTPKLNAKTLVAFATDAPGTVWYCAIDSVSANNAATPFHVFAELMSGDAGYRLIAQSKPLPARNSRATCTCVAVD